MPTKVLSLWKNTSKKGTVYYSGKVTETLKEGTKLVGYENKYRDGDENKPFLNIYLSEEKLPF